MALLSAFRVRTEVCGLDIGPTMLRAAQLKTPKQHAGLVGVSEVTLAKKAFDKNTLIDTDGFASALQTLLQSSQPNRITAKAIVAALPEAYIFTRIIQLPHLAPAELRKALPFEVGQYLPVPVEDVYFDYTPLALRPDKQQIDVALFAAPRTLVDPLIDVIHSQGLELYALETKSTAATRALVSAGISDAVLIIEIGNNATRLTVVDHGDVWLTASLNTGEIQLLRTLVEKSGQSVAQVKTALTKDDGTLAKMIGSAIDPIIQEAVAVTRYHETRDFEPNKLARALLVGQGASIPGLDTILANHLHLKCELGVPLVTSASTPDLRYTVALGLSMRAL